MALSVDILRGHHLSLEYTDILQITARLPVLGSPREIYGRFMAKMFPIFTPPNTHGSYSGTLQLLPLMNLGWPYDLLRP